MAKYRVEFDHKQIISMTPAGAAAAEGPRDGFLEEQIGETISAIIEAASDEEAREKAARLQTELQTGRTKRDLTGRGDRSADSERGQNPPSSIH
jgi:hypothetical protein